MLLNLFGVGCILAAALTVYGTPEKYRHLPWCWIVGSVFLGLGIQYTFVNLYANAFVAYVFYGLAIYTLIEYDLRTVRELILSQASD